jgi:rhodanese-related sulfurtransferase
MTTDADTPLDITPEELARRIAAGAAPLLLDVRQPEEHAYVSLVPSTLIPLPELAARLAELAKTQEIVAYCHHGVRSRHAAVFLRAQGYTRARTLVGGIDAWTNRVDPSLPRY